MILYRKSIIHQGTQVSNRCTGIYDLVANDYTFNNEDWTLSRTSLNWFFLSFNFNLLLFIHVLSLIHDAIYAEIWRHKEVWYRHWKCGIDTEKQWSPKRALEYTVFQCRGFEEILLIVTNWVLPKRYLFKQFRAIPVVSSIVSRAAFRSNSTRMIQFL